MHPSYPPPPPPHKTATLLEQVTQMALRARLKEARSVTADISCDAFSLLAGRVNSVTIKGEGWRSPLDLTAQTLEVGVTGAAPRLRGAPGCGSGSGGCCVY